MKMKMTRLEKAAIANLRAHMREHRLKQINLRHCLGRQSRVSKILNGRLRLNLNDISKLHYKLGIPLYLLIGG